jgi:GNAT superfamily N-acetyltransferase
MEPRLARTDAEIAACFAVMKELRTHLVEAEFVPKVRRLQETGYRLAYLEDEGSVAAVAGFRVGESLPWQRFLYVDDLVTASGRRSRGLGARLLRWLLAVARREGCTQLHLDSGTHREAAHRFYRREGLTLSSYHFRVDL